jgi:hypothetical protein
MNLRYKWPLSDIDFKASCRVELGNQKEVCQGYLVAYAVSSLGTLKKLFKGSESSDNNPLNPWSFLVVTESCTDFRNDTRILDRLSACVNLFAKSSNLPPLQWVAGQQFG